MRDFSRVKRIVVKVGTNLLSTRKGIDENKIRDIVSQIVTLKAKGFQVLLVTSGAIGMGSKELGLKTKVKNVGLRQACAAIGQPILMYSYRKAFEEYDTLCSQILITKRDMNDRHSYLNLGQSVSELLELGVVPIFNENDAISTSEIDSTFGDNDRMSAMVASKMDADLLIILTDIDGLYTADPKKDENAQLMLEIDKIDEKVLSMAGGAGSAFSTGGMKTKLLAAIIASGAGCGSIIASGYEENALVRLASGEDFGTYIHPRKRQRARQRWIMNNTNQATIIIDDGARKALRENKSLLPAGVVGVDGSFERGEVVQVVDVNGRLFAKAVPYISSNDLTLIAGKKTREIRDIMGPDFKSVIFRPEEMVLVDE